MIDPQSLDEPFLHELEHLRVGLLEHVRVFDPHTRQVVDVEEAAIPTRARVPVEHARARREVGPQLVLFLGRRHVIRHDVEDHAEAGRTGGSAERAELRLAAEVVRDARRVDGVVAVRRAVPRLQGGER